MSVHVRLNNKAFFGGNSVIIGSRLYEADESQNNAQQNNRQQQQQNVQQPQQAQQPQQNQQQQQVQQPQQQQQNQQNQQNQQTLDQQVNGIIINGFVNMAKAVAVEFQKIQLPQGFQWVAPGQMQEQSVNGAIQMAQNFLKANIEVAKKAIENAQQQNNNQNQQNNQNTNNNQAAQ